MYKVTYNPINELDILLNPMNILATQNAVIEAVRNTNYLVMSVDTYGVVSVSPRPAAHDCVLSARKESKRLAIIYPGKLFIIVKLQGAEMVPTTTISI